MPDRFDFTAFPQLETERLLLRDLTPADASAVFRIRGDYQVTRYNSGAPFRRLEQARELIDAIGRAYDRQEEIRWGITIKARPDTVIGICGYNYWIRRDYRGCIGYDLARVYWGRGIMTEAVRAVVEFGFERMGLNRIEADADLRNPASIRVLLKLGFQQEGIQREQFYEEGAFHDLALFALLKKEYEWAAPSSI